MMSGLQATSGSGGENGKELLMSDHKPRFDFAAFKDAFERKDAERWAQFYTEDAEWIEYKPSAPPRDPVRMVGRERIAEFLASLEMSEIEITLSDEVLGDGRAAFSVDVTLPDGKRVFEHTIVHIEDGRVARQVDVEAWD
jgi:ketosteroid isomerase-like protein